MKHRRASWLAPLVPFAPLSVALLTALAFLPTLRNGWVTWDDDKNFLENPSFRGLGADQLAWMWGTFHLGHYVPLSWMSLGLDYTLWGMEPAGYHATSLALHVLNGVLLFFIARRLIAAARGTDDDTTAWSAAVAALAWSLHPLRVESVAWITERRDVLSGAFYFGALLAYLRSCTVPARRAGWYWVSVLAFVAALLSKATAVTLLAVLVIVNVYPLGRIGGAAGWWNDAARRAWRDLVPFAALSAGFSALTFVALQPVDQLSAAGKLAVSAYSLCFYLLKTILPVGLSPLYEMPVAVSLGSPRFAASVVTVVLLAFAVWRLAPRIPALAAAALAFAVMLFPLLGVHQNGPQIAADRYTYIASAAIAIVAAALLALPRLPRLVSRGAAAGIVVLLGALTWQQLAVWHDGDALWAQVVRVEPRSSLGNNNLGNLLMQRGDVDAARERYETAVETDPRNAEAHDNLGVALARKGAIVEAVQHYRTALDINPRQASAHVNWGVALARQGDFAGAIAHYGAALAIDPSSADAHVNWANALVRQGRVAEAAEHYRAALSLRPDDVPAHLNWGAALAQQGQLAEAIEHFRAVLAVDANQPDARAYLAQAMRDLEARAARR
ncbi:MAG TPA: tetratricopeptide repeat protein [Gemmatimonadaceae bacterium]